MLLNASEDLIVYFHLPFPISEFSKANSENYILLNFLSLVSELLTFTLSSAYCTHFYILLVTLYSN
jgi:hypothetical protein